MSDAQPLVPTEKEIEKGKTMALLSWLSIVIGFPIWIIPLVQRDNAYALYHAKHAGLTFLAAVGLAVIFIVITWITCGLGAILFPVLFVVYVPAIDGVIKAAGGRAEPPLLIGGLTDAIFGSIQVDESKRELD